MLSTIGIQKKEILRGGHTWRDREREGRNERGPGKPGFGRKDAGYSCVEKVGCTSWAVGEERRKAVLMTSA